MRYGLLLSLALCGCGTSLNYIPTSSSPRQLSARSADEVEIFMTGAPNRPYVEVGMIESQQEEYSVDDEQEVIQKMRNYAGERGCDALVIFSGNDATVDHGGSNQSSIRTLKGYRGSCVVYTGQPQAPAASSCIPNTTQLCYGPGGCRGGQSCTADGKGYTVCDCGNTAPQAATP
jgi:hypothetical protein